MGLGPSAVSAVGGRLPCAPSPSSTPFRLDRAAAGPRPLETRTGRTACPVALPFLATRRPLAGPQAAAGAPVRPGPSRKLEHCQCPTPALEPGNSVRMGTDRRGPEGSRFFPPLFRVRLAQGVPKKLAGSPAASVTPAASGRRKSALLLATNPETTHTLKRAGASEVHLFPDNGIVPAWLQPQPPQRKRKAVFSLLWAGRLELRKGFPLALEALAAARSAPVRMLVAGAGPMESAWRKLTRTMGLQKQVQFLGMVPWNDMRDLFLNVDALFLHQAFTIPFLQSFWRPWPADFPS